MPVGDDVAVPAEHGVRPHQQPHPAQYLLWHAMEERRQERPVARVEPNLLSVQLPLQNAIWWRRARISTSFSRSLIGSSRSIVNAFVTLKYASLNSTTDHHAAPTAAAR